MMETDVKEEPLRVNRGFVSASVTTFINRTNSRSADLFGISFLFSICVHSCILFVVFLPL